MNNIDKAAQVIREHDSDGACGEPECLPQDLADAGLLMPELPEPDDHYEENTYWHEGTFQVGISDKFGKIQVTFADSEPGGVLYKDIESAQDYALKILAACEYAEKETDNA